MKRMGIKGGIVVALLAALTDVIGAERIDVGKIEYETNCILCHGRDLRGGAYVDMLKVLVRAAIRPFRWRRNEATGLAAQ
ncbi:cytochrome c [Accumulibacter sp.]|jgi:mono/diheme cytochrome c family protein|uniref:Cytochrome c domain-containing protein n=1 Tax=Accumulibacter regalis TaxID=522306 RepID=C7RUH4_ACCRE|nr:cytochrome c [Accumulibacter sp.]MBN8499522.1 cytochrome c [Accumulibacter sp.]MBO3714965.1 cytochrome c [Accumulibacter sp.]